MDVRIKDDGRTNPLLTVTEEALIAWLRKLADEAGYEDRGMSGIQVVITDGDGKPLPWNGVPKLTIMVSNILNSR